MKIVHICLCGPMTDGLNYQENLLSKYHKKMGYDVTVVASRYIWGENGCITKMSKTNYVNNDGVKMRRLDIIKGNINSRLKIYKGLSKCLDEEKPDILFVHDCQFLDMLTLAGYAKRNKNVQVFVDNHVDYSNGAHGWISRNILHKGLWKFCVKRIEPYVKKFYGVLPARVDFLVEMYNLPKETCDLLIMGADDDFVKKYSAFSVRLEYRKEYGISDDDILLVTGGKIDLAKKQTLLLMDAVNQIDNPKLKLIVFGSVVSGLKNEVEKRCSKKVKYIGWISSEESYPHFAMADLVVFPGRHSVFWEQVAGQGVPMVVRFWPGTSHVDCGGNVRFLYKDSIDEITDIVNDCLYINTLKEMTVIAKAKKDFFMYSKIAKKSISG